MDPWQAGTYADHYNRIYDFDVREIEAYLAPLQLGKADRFIDFGCGSGAAIAVAAPRVEKAVGLDVSLRQIELARERLSSFPNVELVHSDFLECSFGGSLFSRGAGRKSLHHLTDPEKTTFFQRIGPMFAEGALFLVEDGIFDFPRDRLEEQMPRILAEAAPYYGDRWDTIRPDFLITMREEFPTSSETWEAALRAGGFKPISLKRRTCFYGALLACKETR
ncbi:MAG: class I SAM-dependent methyltransferase [Candidatus Ozemobacteraceae bacterium]